MSKESGGARPQPKGRGGPTELGAAFFAFVLRHADCGDGVAESRLDERSVACWCRRCDELRIFTATGHEA